MNCHLETALLKKISKFPGCGPLDSPMKDSATPSQKHYYLSIVNDSHIDMFFWLAENCKI